MWIIKVLSILSLSLVLANGFPKFGDKIRNNDKKDSFVEVFMKSPTEQKPFSESSGIGANHKNERPVNDNNNNNGYARGQTFQYKYSTSRNENNDFFPNDAKFDDRTGLGADDHKQHYDSPDFSSFDFDLPEASASHHYQQPAFHGPPPPPSPPKPPQQSEHHSQQFQPTNYDDHEERQDFHHSQPQQNYRKNTIKIDPEFSFNVPQGFPHPKNDPRANFKKEMMGLENNKGKPWGEKRSYTYRDPKNPNNYMQMSEVRMSMNKQMDPKEAQTQVQKFLSAAQNGNYGPFSSQSNHNNNYDSNGSQFDSHEPPEPSEPKFPHF